MPKMRTIEQAAKWIKEMDPNSALTKNGLRQLILANRIPSCRCGTKILVNLERIEDFLSGSLEESKPGAGEIRQIAEKIERLG